MRFLVTNYLPILSDQEAYVLQCLSLASRTSQPRAHKVGGTQKVPRISSDFKTQETAVLAQATKDTDTNKENKWFC